MSRVSSLIVGPYGLDDIQEAPSERSLSIRTTEDARLKDPKLKMLHGSLESVQNTAVERISKSPTRSSRSRSPGAFHLGRENVSPKRNISYTALHSDFRQASHVVGSPAEIPIRDPAQKSKQTSCLPVEDDVDNFHLDLDALQIGFPSMPRSGRLSVVNVDQEDLERHPPNNVQSHVSNESSEEEASVDVRPCSNCLPSRDTSPRIIITSTPPKTLKRFIGSSRRRRSNGPSHLAYSEERQDLGGEFEPRLENSEHLGVPPLQEHGHHRKTSSGFSSMFRTTQISAIPNSPSSSGKIGSQKTHRSRLSRFSNRSSRLSSHTKRTSLDSDSEYNTSLHKSTIQRALQRRRIIAELIDSESGYLADLRILTYVYLAILGGTPMFDKNRLNRIENDLNSMMILHEDILKGMKSIAQKSTTTTEDKRGLPKAAKHARYSSIESLRSVARGHKTFNGWAITDAAKSYGLQADPKEGADIAKLFGKMFRGTANTEMGKFSVYERYGANYAEMLQACISASQDIPVWEGFERGIEALVNKVMLPGKVPREDRKALTLEDLLIKPIQRICKYPLLFAELESYCPAVDDPESLVTISKILNRLRETAHEVNNATNDLEAQARLQRSQHLEDLLTFPDTLRPSFSLVRDLGHATLCGVLFVVYQTQNGGIRGAFMLCALFKSYILLASPETGYRHFRIGAIIRLDNLQLDVADSERGLQCLETPYAWKSTFEADHRLYELLFCACTELEAQHWKFQLQEASGTVKQGQDDSDCNCASPSPEFLFIDVKQYVHNSETVGSVSRGRSLLRTSESEARVRLVPVIIKNTFVSVKGDHADLQNQAATSVSRSPRQVTNEVGYTLFAERSERTRMEQAMSEVWTRGTLPFPGMKTSRSGQFIRASASMMRKLSKTSITSTPSKRSVSQSSHAGTIENGPDKAMDDPFVEHPTRDEPHALKAANIAAEMPVLRDQSGNTRLRNLSFSNEITRPRRKGADDDGSETSTIVGKKSGKKNHDGITNGRGLSKALSRERIKAWFS